jgi:hypothetical protein
MCPQLCPIGAENWDTFPFQERKQGSVRNDRSESYTKFSTASPQARRVLRFTTRAAVGG